MANAVSIEATALLCHAFGREALVRRWLQIPLSRLIEQLRQRCLIGSGITERRQSLCEVLDAIKVRHHRKLIASIALVSHQGAMKERNADTTACGCSSGAKCPLAEIVPTCSTLKPASRRPLA